MLLFIKFAGLLFIAVGALSLFNPGIMKPYIAFWQKGKRLMIGGMLSLLFAVLFLSSASNCRIPIVISVCGIMSFIKGVMILLLGSEKMKTMLDWWYKRPASMVRMFGPIVIIFGILIIYSV